jgi:hypothetical protein
MSTQPTSTLQHHPPADVGTGLQPILQALDGLVASAEPAVVFTSATRLCVPVLCDAATATIMSADQQAYQARWPWAWDRADQEDVALFNEALAGSQVFSPSAVLTPIVGLSTQGFPDYQGVLALSFLTSGPSPSHGVLAQLVVERAVAAIERERLVETVTARQVEAEHLRIALASNRQISTAIGILMANHKLTSEHAFDLLRRVSQYSHRKLRDVALDIVDTGTIELPRGVPPLAVRTGSLWSVTGGQVTKTQSRKLP